MSDEEVDPEDHHTWLVRSTTWRSKRLDRILLLCDTELQKKLLQTEEEGLAGFFGEAGINSIVVTLANLQQSAATAVSVTARLSGAPVNLSRNTILTLRVVREHAGGVDCQVFGRFRDFIVSGEDRSSDSSQEPAHNSRNRPAPQATVKPKGTLLRYLKKERKKKTRIENAFSGLEKSIGSLQEGQEARQREAEKQRAEEWKEHELRVLQMQQEHETRTVTNMMGQFMAMMGQFITANQQGSTQ
ncbi:Hypp6182 [Branchiostoma lanceolatum]|uniref:Hypp6182 protein n=1 Tax=Branchiostoma lanceolatum TaxID=7740 RepID=A0A8J9VJ26_BRALA|nr:Hypp6182 [Branchiostoma lanceolatum]